MKNSCLLCCLVLGLLPQRGTKAATVMVFAAASLTESLKSISTSYEQKTGNTLRFNFAASSFLALQIAEGAQADLFLSADEAKMDRLEEAGLIAPGTRMSILSNGLVFVATKDSPLRIERPGDLLQPAIHRIAVADPRAVPAGIYAREYLQRVGLWETLQKKLVPTDNVRAALSAVESGDIELGIVYSTDARISSKVRVVYEVPSRDSPRISYSVAVLKTASQPAIARELEAYLNSPDSRRIFRKFGFITPE